MQVLKVWQYTDNLHNIIYPIGGQNSYSNPTAINS
jgi:hypothetical protein